MKEQPEFTLIGTGLVVTHVCTRLDDAETERRTNVEVPTGISSRWTVSDAAPATCADDPRNRHISLTC